MDEPHPCYKRILLKLSGEALKGTEVFGISGPVITAIVDQLREIRSFGCQVAVVIGGGNYFRGVRSNNIGLHRASADYMGMLATVMNGIALRDVCAGRGLPARLISALEITAVAEPFMRRRVVDYLEKGDVVIFSAGTGNPFFTTDTAAALRAVEIDADILLKATMVDGVYSKDPKKFEDAVRFDHLSYDEVLKLRLEVMDATAVALCRENNLPVKIFNIGPEGNITRAVTDEKLGTVIG